ncbi:response regulator transcription factor [Massilia yuzhufengensis]|uniref:Two component transcriptional regulator, winged helix family n=1 Tax=Massilia yuzhufengensis TaxID=1164594 RepID=A0A1I1JD19_9BURK|nr:response regulator transcription factor [Massilia yuzhufengensis]SFC46499.1 two component transcriptional regulator, winged helix family [Massilia yuzhufengensis]
MPLPLLLVEDDTVLADGLVRTLHAQDMQVELVRDGVAADARLQGAQPAVLILDIGLPGIDGFEVLRRLRARGAATPVLLLTARDAVEDRVRGLETGADDYLVKPFASAELVARIRALARRFAPPPAHLGLAHLSLDSATRRARVGERVLDLSAREWGVLEYLLQQAGRVVSKQQIIDAIAPWGDDLTLNAVEVYVSRLRLKLDGAGVAIRTIRGFGYLLEAA